MAKYTDKQLEQLMAMYNDEHLEQLWEELSDVPVYEDEDGWLCLENDWFVNDWFFFPSGTEREEI